MKTSMDLVNKLTKQPRVTPFELGRTYELNYPESEMTEDSVIMCEDKELPLSILLNLYTKVERISDGEFIKPGTFPTTVGQDILNNSTSFTVDLPKTITVVDRLMIATTERDVRKKEGAEVFLKGYELHGIDMTRTLIPVLIASQRRGAAYDCKSDFKVKTKIVVKVEY